MNSVCETFENNISHGMAGLYECQNSFRNRDPNRKLKRHFITKFGRPTFCITLTTGNYTWWIFRILAGNQIKSLLGRGQCRPLLFAPGQLAERSRSHYNTYMRKDNTTTGTVFGYSFHTSHQAGLSQPPGQYTLAFPNEFLWKQISQQASLRFSR
jgi:hypothetical protein